MTLDDLRAICPHAKPERLAAVLVPLNLAMDEYEINTPQRQAAFIAQVAHESGSFRYVREIASGEAYEGRRDLGNTEPGDGVRFRGRGYIQITGRANYRSCGDALGLDLLSEPELLELPHNAARSAGWFWKRRGLNELADKLAFETITKRINGGLNGYEDRLAYYGRAQGALHGPARHEA